MVHFHYEDDRQYSHLKNIDILSHNVQQSETGSLHLTLHGVAVASQHTAPEEKLQSAFGQGC